MKNTTCDHCGEPLPKTHRRWCAKPECQRAKDLFHKKQLREYWKRHGGTRRKPDGMKPKFSNRPCLMCKRDLGKTANMFYHPDCHKKISRIEGIEKI